MPSFQNRCIFPHALSMKRLVDPQFVPFLTRVTLYLTVAKVWNKICVVEDDIMATRLSPDSLKGRIRVIEFKRKYFQGITVAST